LFLQHFQGWVKLYLPCRTGTGSCSYEIGYGVQHNKCMECNWEVSTNTIDELKLKVELTSRYGLDEYVTM